jgi:glycosyltransferase involved in cell wall biosynthesis
VRVLFVTHSYPRHAGDVAGNFILRLAVALQSRGVQVRVLAPAAPGLPAQDELDGIRVDRFRYAPVRWQTLAYDGTMAEQVATSLRGKLALGGMLLAGSAATRRAATAFPADVVHAHWWFPLGVSAAWSGSSRPLVVTMHGSDVRLAATSRFAPAMYRSVARRARRMTAVSGWLARTASAFGGPDVAVAPMPVDTSLFAAGGAARARSALFVGRLNAQKGASYLVPALRAMPTDVTLDVVGDGPDAEATRRQATEAGVAGRIRWHGALPQERVAPLYRGASVVIVPSREEGLGLVCVEAQLSETPVVAFRSGGVVDVVADGATGVLVPEGDAAALGRAAGVVIDDAPRRAAWGAEGRRRMIERFGAARVAEGYERVYREAVVR